MYMRNSNNLKDIVVYNQQKRHHRNIIQPQTKTQKLDQTKKIDAVVKKNI